MKTKFEVLHSTACSLADKITEAEIEHERATKMLFAQLPEHALRPHARALFEAAAKCPEWQPFKPGERVRHRLRHKLSIDQYGEFAYVLSDKGAVIDRVHPLLDDEPESDWNLVIEFGPKNQCVVFTAFAFERVPEVSRG